MDSVSWILEIDFDYPEELMKPIERYQPPEDSATQVILHFEMEINPRKKYCGNCLRGQFILHLALITNYFCRFWLPTHSLSQESTAMYKFPIKSFSAKIWVSEVHQLPIAVLLYIVILVGYWTVGLGL